MMGFESLAPVQNGGPFCDFEITHSLLVFVLDKASKSVNI